MTVRVVVTCDKRGREEERRGGDEWDRGTEGQRWRSRGLPNGVKLPRSLWLFSFKPKLTNTRCCDNFRSTLTTLLSAQTQSQAVRTRLCPVGSTCSHLSSSTRLDLDYPRFRSSWHWRGCCGRRLRRSHPLGLVSSVHPNQTLSFALRRSTVRRRPSQLPSMSWMIHDSTYCGFRIAAPLMRVQCPPTAGCTLRRPWTATSPVLGNDGSVFAVIQFASSLCPAPPVRPPPLLALTQH